VVSVYLLLVCVNKLISNILNKIVYKNTISTNVDKYVLLPLCT